MFLVGHTVIPLSRLVFVASTFFRPYPKTSPKSSKYLVSIGVWNQSLDSGDVWGFKHNLFWVERIRYLEYLDSKSLGITPIYKPFILAMNGDRGPKQPDP